MSTDTPKTALELFNDAVRREVAQMRAENGCARMQNDPHSELDLGPVPPAQEHTFLVPATIMVPLIYSGATRESLIPRALKWAEETVAGGGTGYLNVQGFVPDVSALEAELAAITPPVAIEDTPEVLARAAGVRAYAEIKVARGLIARRIVNKHLQALGIEPLVGPKNFTFAVPVVPAPTASYEITANTEEEAVALLAIKLDEERAAGRTGKKVTLVPTSDAVPQMVLAVDV